MSEILKVALEFVSILRVFIDLREVLVVVVECPSGVAHMFSVSGFLQIAEKI